MPTGVGLALGASALGGILGGQASKDAATSQADAAKDASWYQNQQYQQQREDQAPWRQAGISALSQMQDPRFQKTFGAADFQKYEDPGYANRIAQGQNAINSAAAARGLANSGATMKALANYNQDQASNEFQNAYNRFNNDQSTNYNRLSALAGVGQSATNQLGQAGQSYAGQMGQNAMAIGNAAAAGQMGQSNALTGAIGGGMNAWMQNNLMNKIFPSSPSGGSSVTSGLASTQGSPSGYLGNYNF